MFDWMTIDYLQNMFNDFQTDEELNKFADVFWSMFSAVGGG